MKMSFICRLMAICALCSLLPERLQAFYQCGIRKHSFVPLIHQGWTVEEGQWPWHCAIFHKQQNGSWEYACGGTLLGENHVLTAAHCAANRETEYALPASSFELHFGQQNLSKVTNHVQIRDVSKVHIHPEYSAHRNDIAILVMRLPVSFTDFVIPICLDQKADIDLRNLEGKRGWITGWGTTSTGSLSDVLHTASLPVVSYVQCLEEHAFVFGNLLNPNVFCAGDRNGTGPGTGDSGGGIYFNDGDQWVLRGIVSFGKAIELKKEVDSSSYTIFVNVQRFLTWIREITDVIKPQSVRPPKRISEIECDRFKTYARKRKNGACDNSRYPHTVILQYPDDLPMCNGVLVNEDHVLTSVVCFSALKRRRPSELPKVLIDAYGLVDILDIKRHPERAVFRRYYHNLAIIKLRKPVPLSSNIIPACLANNWTENLYDTLVQTGYGGNPEQGFKKFFESEDNLVISKERCEKNIQAVHNDEFPLGLEEGIKPEHLCVVNTDGLRTTRGSDGSPLQSVNTRSCMHTVVGIASFGIGIHEGVLEESYSVTEIYTRVSHYLDWIEHVIWNGEPPVTTTVSDEQYYPDWIKELLRTIELNMTTTVTADTTTPTTTTTRKLRYQPDFVFPDD